MSERTIDVGRDFSRYPAGRFVEDGPFSGQRFREEFLLPKIRNCTAVVVVLDEAAGYGSSFLEEAFGGLMRAGISRADIDSFLRLESDDPGLRDEIWGYIDDETRRRAGG